MLDQGHNILSLILFGILDYSVWFYIFVLFISSFLIESDNFIYMLLNVGIQFQVLCIGKNYVCDTCLNAPTTFIRSGINMLLTGLMKISAIYAGFDSENLLSFQVNELKLLQHPELGI